MVDTDMISGIGRPEIGECLPYYRQYIDLVPDGDIIEILERQMDETVRLFEAIPVDRLNRRPAPAEWSPLDIAIHVADGERIFAFRALWIARSVGTEMPGFEPDPAAEAAGANRLTRDDASRQLLTARAASVAFLRNLAPADWLKTGIASGNPISVRALAYIMAGHELWHDEDFRRGMRSEE